MSLGTSLVWGTIRIGRDKTENGRVTINRHAVSQVCRQRQAVAERSAAPECQRNQALKMPENSQAAMQEIEVVTNVRVGVPDLDRSAQTTRS